MKTLAGRDFQADAMGQGAYWMGVTENDDAPVNTDTVLTDEIDSGTLARDAAVYAHTPGSSFYTLTRTLTADQSVVLAKVGIFTEEVDGDLVFEDLLDEVATMTSGDQVTVTVTVNV